MLRRTYLLGDTHYPIHLHLQVRYRFKNEGEFTGDREKGKGKEEKNEIAFLITKNKRVINNQTKSHFLKIDNKSHHAVHLSIDNNFERSAEFIIFLNNGYVSRISSLLDLLSVQIIFVMHHKNALFDIFFLFHYLQALFFSLRSGYSPYAKQ